VFEGVDVVVRTCVEGRLGQHHVHGSWCCRSWSAGLVSHRVNAL